MLYQKIKQRVAQYVCSAILLLSITACAGTANTRPITQAAITLGMDNTAVNTLIYIAQDQKYFAENGIQVTFKTYPSGLAAVTDMLDHQAVDIATASEFIVVGSALADKKIRVWGSIDEFMHNYLIARKDRGIQSAADLSGKTIGLPLKTLAEFYLGRFLELKGMSMDEVRLVDTSPANLVDSLSSGKVDAVVAWQPNARALEDRLGDGVMNWPVQNDQSGYALVISTQAWTSQHPDTARRFLNALAQANTWYAAHPDEAKAVLKKVLGLDDMYIAAIWPEHQFQLSLDQSLILAMEDESRWLIRQQPATGKQPPVFLDYLYLDGMLAVRPEAVNIIRK